MLASSAATPISAAPQQPQPAHRSKESASDSFSMATLSPTSTASTDSSSSTSSHSSPLHAAASAGSSSLSASPSSPYPAAVSVPAQSNMSAALLQQQQQAQQKQHAIASSLLNSMQAHAPASFAHPASAQSASPTMSASSSSSSLSSYPASSSLPTPSAPPSARRRGARRQRSPGHNRVPLWDTVRGKKLSGFASPMEKNLKRYLDEHPNCVLYDRNVHRVGVRTEAGKDGEDDEDEDEDEEVPAELERIISSSPHSASPLSHSPRNPGRVGGQLPPIRGQAARQQSTDAIPRSMPMPVLSSSLPNNASVSPHHYSPAHSPLMSPQHSPSAKIAIKFEQLTMQQSASSNSLSSLASSSSASSGKVRKGGKKLTQSPRNKPILLAPNAAVASKVAIEGSARSTVISRRMGSGEDELSYSYHADGQPIMAATAVHPPSFHHTLSVSVPLPSHVPHSIAARPLTVDTYFEGHSPHHSHSHHPYPHNGHYPQLHSSTLSRSTTCSPSHSSPSHVDPFSASSLNLSPRRSNKTKYARAHPYHGDRTPKYSDGRGRLDEEAESKESGGRVGWSHSLPSSGPHPGIFAPPAVDVGVDEIGHVCTCGGAQQYTVDGYYVQHAHGEASYDPGLPVGYHSSGLDVHHMAQPSEMTDDYGLHGHHHSYPHSHAHSHAHAHSHSHSHAPSAHYHSHASHHSTTASSMHEHLPMRILSPVNGLSSAHSVSSESTHSSSSSNPSSKHLVFSRPLSPTQPHSPHTSHSSHSRTSPPLPAPTPTLYAVEVEHKSDGQTVVHHHHHYQVPAPALSPSAWLDDRAMADEGSQYYSSAGHVVSGLVVAPSPVPHSHSHSQAQSQHGQWIAGGEALESRWEDAPFLAPTDHHHGVGGVNDYDLSSAFDFSQLH